MTRYDAVLMKALPDLKEFKAVLTFLNNEDKNKTGRNSFEEFVNDSFEDLVDIFMDRNTETIKNTAAYFPTDPKKQIHQIELLQIEYTWFQTKLLYEVLFSKGEKKNKINEQVDAISNKAIDVLLEYTALNILRYKIELVVGGLGDKGVAAQQVDAGNLEETLERNRREMEKSYQTLKEMVCGFYNVLK